MLTSRPECSGCPVAGVPWEKGLGRTGHQRGSGSTGRLNRGGSGCGESGLLGCPSMHAVLLCSCAGSHVSPRTSRSLSLVLRCPHPKNPSSAFDSLPSKRVVFSHVPPGSPPSLPVPHRFPVFPGPLCPFPVRALPAPMCHPQPRASELARAAPASPTITPDDVTTAPT